MIDALKPYATMKDSGVPWLGEVPEHWVVYRLRNTADMRVSNVDKHTKDGELPVRLCNYVDVYKNDRITDRVPFMKASALSSEIERFSLQRGDVLITKDSEAWNDIGVPALVQHTADDLLCGYHLALLRPFECIDGRFLFRVLQSKSVAYQFHVEANGVTRYGLSHAAIKSIWLPIAPLPEQAAIVRFLDCADRRIRNYILAKQKLIKLLEEEKQAIIHHAVTCGLDPNVRLKHSGVEWLGDVPEHWEVSPLKHLVPQVTVGIVIQPARLYIDKGVPCLRSFNISSGVIRPDDLAFISEQSNAEHRKSQIFAGDIVVVRTGHAGIAAIVTPEFDGANCIDLLIVRRSKKLLSEYMLTFFNSWPARTDVKYRSVGAIQAHYNTATLANLIIAVPPLVEQETILDDLAAKLGPISQSTRTAQREIDLLREYRTRLVADVVTGKLDVRGAAKILPDEAPEPEALDELDDLPQDESATENLELEAADAS